MVVHYRLRRRAYLFLGQRAIPAAVYYRVECSRDRGKLKTDLKFATILLYRRGRINAAMHPTLRSQFKSDHYLISALMSFDRF